MGGTFKRHIRDVSQRRQSSWTDAVKTESGDVRCAAEMHKQLVEDYGGTKRKENNKRLKTDEFVFLLAEPGEIERPAKKIDHDGIEDVKKHFCFFAMRPGVVLKREFSCWCTACVAAFLDGPACRTNLQRHYRVMENKQDKLDSYLYKVSACTKTGSVNESIYSWDAHRSDCRPKKGPNIDDRDKEVCKLGIAVATTLEKGDLCLVESTEYPEDMWLAEVVVPAHRHSGAKNKQQKRVKSRGGTTVFYGGEYQLNVKFLKRVLTVPATSYSEMLEFYKDNTAVVDVVQAREVRARVTRFSVDTVRIKGIKPKVERITLDRSEEARALCNCR